MQQQDFLDAAADMSNLPYGAGPEHSHHQQSTMQLRSDTAQNGAMQPLSDIVQGSAFSQGAMLAQQAAQQAGTFACVIGLPHHTNIVSLHTMCTTTPWSSRLTLWRTCNGICMLPHANYAYHGTSWASAIAQPEACPTFCAFAHGSSIAWHGSSGMLVQVAMRKQQQQLLQQLSPDCDGRQSFTLVLLRVSVS